MTIITKSELSNYAVTGEFDIEFSIKSDEDSSEKKTGTLRFKLDSVPLGDIIQSSLKDKRINWQASARKNFNSIQPGIITVDYKGGRQPVDPKQSTKAYLASLSPEDRMKWLKEQGLI